MTILHSIQSAADGAVDKAKDVIGSAESYVADSWLGGWSPADVPDMSGKVALVTGGNSGLGFETTRKLVENGAHVYLVSRVLSNGVEAADKIRKEVGKAARVDVLQCDMSKLENVASLAKEFKRQSNKLDILVNMAGVFHPGPFAKTVDGLEQTLAINYYAHALLTLLLLDRLKSTRGSRVIFMASAAEKVGRLSWDNLKGDQYTNSGMTPYGTAKMMMLMFAKDLSVRVPEVDFLCVHPGLVLTPIQHKTSMRYWTANLTVSLARVAGQTPKRGAWSTIYAATEPSLTGARWGYWGPNNLNLWPTTRRNPGNWHVRDEWKCWKVTEETVRILTEATHHKYPLVLPLHPAPDTQAPPHRSWVPKQLVSTVKDTVNTARDTVQKVLAQGVPA